MTAHAGRFAAVYHRVDDVHPRDETKATAATRLDELSDVLVGYAPLLQAILTGDMARARQLAVVAETYLGNRIRNLMTELDRS